MSARSRALEDLAAHFRALRDGAAGELDPHAPSIYNGYELWDRAADMASRTADDSTWSARVLRVIRWRHRRLDRARKNLRIGSAGLAIGIRQRTLRTPSVPGIWSADIDWNQVRQTFRQSATCWDHLPMLPFQKGPDGVEWTTCVNCGRDLARWGGWSIVGLLRRSGPATQEENNGE